MALRAVEGFVVQKDRFLQMDLLPSALRKGLSSAPPTLRFPVGSGRCEAEAASRDVLISDRAGVEGQSSEHSFSRGDDGQQIGVVLFPGACCLPPICPRPLACYGLVCLFAHPSVISLCTFLSLFSDCGMFEQGLSN